MKISRLLSMIYAGRGGGIRTPDRRLPKQMRYQAALRPDSDLIVTRMGFPLEWLRRLAPRERIRMPVPVGTQASFRRTPAKGCRRARAPHRSFCDSRRVVKLAI